MKSITPATYIINSHGHFFAVSSEIELQRLEGCRILSSKEEMYSLIIDEQCLDADEVIEEEIILTVDDGVWVSINGNTGINVCKLNPGEQMASFISRFVL